MNKGTLIGAVLVAGAFGFRKQDYFELDSEAERSAPGVSFGD